MDSHCRSTPSAHFRCSSLRCLSSPNRGRCCWPFGDYYCWCCRRSDSSGSSCSTRISYSKRTSAGMEDHSVRSSVRAHQVVVLRGTVDKEGVSGVRPPLLVCSKDQRPMEVLLVVLGHRDTANRPDKRGLRTTAGMPRNCLPLPRAPNRLPFDASIWFCGGWRRRDKMESEFAV